MSWDTVLPLVDQAEEKAERNQAVRNKLLRGVGTWQSNSKYGRGTEEEGRDLKSKPRMHEKVNADS